MRRQEADGQIDLNINPSINIHLFDDINMEETETW